MKNIMFALLIIYFTCIGVQGQESCKLSLSQAPKIRGLQLGMTTSQLLDLIPYSKDEAHVKVLLEKSLAEKVTLTMDPREEQFKTLPLWAGLNQLSVSFFDGHVTDIYLSYERPYWENTDDFIAKLVENVKLPDAKNWVGSGSYKRLGCTDFDVLATVVTDRNSCCSSLSLRDLTADKKIIARQNSRLSCRASRGTGIPPR